MTFTLFIRLIPFMLLTSLDLVATEECQHTMRVKRGEHFNLKLHNFTTSPKRRQYCTLKVSTEKNMLIILDLMYTPPHGNGKIPIDCDSDYVHVGNDVRRVDVELMTSYKFCGEEIKHELISRGNEMWVVYKSTQKPRQFYISIKADVPDLTATQKNPKEPCFRCGDGTCIQPRLSRYDIGYGRVLWYLCDGFSHCPDAWDERGDICMALGSRLGAITECIPFDLEFGHNGSVVMWNEIRCNGNPDCYFGDDEDDCEDKRKGVYDDAFRISGDSLALRLGLTLGIVATVCLIAFIVYKIRNASHNEASRPSTTSTEDSVDEDANKGLRSSQSQADENIKENGSNAHSVSDLDDDDDDQSSCSIQIKNTTV